MSSKPPLADLAQYSAAGVKADVLAGMYGVAPSTAAGWLVEARTSVGKSAKQVKAKKRARGDYEAEAERMLTLAIANVDDDVMWKGSASDMAKHTRLCLEVRDACIAAAELASGDSTQADRPELLERMRKATAGAAALRVVKDPTG